MNAQGLHLYFMQFNCIQPNWRSCKEYLRLQNNRHRKDCIYIVRNSIVYNLIGGAVKSIQNFRVIDAKAQHLYCTQFNCIQPNWWYFEEYLEHQNNRYRKDCTYIARNLIAYNLIGGVIKSIQNFRVIDARPQHLYCTQFNCMQPNWRCVEEYLEIQKK